MDQGKILAGSAPVFARTVEIPAGTFKFPALLDRQVPVYGMAGHVEKRDA